MLNNTQLNNLDGITKLYVDDKTNQLPEPDEFQFISDLSDLPTTITNVINLIDNKTYYFTTEVDLNGNRLIAGENTTIIGGSSENCRIKSTGLTQALITSNYSLPIRFITLESDLVLDLNGDGLNTAIDWFGVNFTDCVNIGTIKNYTNFIMQDSAFLNSGGLKFDGTIGTIGFGQCLFNNYPGTTAVSILPTATISRRFRTSYSSFISLSGETSISFSPSASIPTESYILDTVNFSGGGTYLIGPSASSNKTLFVNCTNIRNTSVNGQLYMNNNAVATIIATASTFVNVAGTSSASTDNEKYLHSNNRLTCDAVIERKYLVQCTLSFASGNNNICEFGFYDSKLGSIRTPSITKSTANASGRAENITFMCVVSHKQGDYIEVWASNTSSATNITVSDMNLLKCENYSKYID
jgi:hypothetical protein